MRLIKTITIFATFLLLICQQVWAGEENQTGTDALIEDIQEQLNLTSEQLEDLKPIIKEEQEKLKEKLDSTLKQGFAQFDQLSEQLKEASSRIQEQANQILTSEEMAQFKEYLNNLDKQKVAETKDALIAEMQELLDLTAEQTQKIGPILDQSFTELSELLRSAMTSGEKNFNDFKTQLRELREQLREQLNDILDEQQMQKLEEHDNELEEGIQRAIFPTSDTRTGSA